MSWTLVGGKVFTVAAGTGSVAVSLPGSPAVDDIVLVQMCVDGGSPDVTSAGYTIINKGSSSVDAVGHGCEYKVLTSAETEVDIEQDGGDPVIGIIQVWRGVDTGQPIDNGNGTEDKLGTGYPDPGTYTTLTNGALRVICGFLDDDDEASSVAAPSGYSNLMAHDTGNSSGSQGCTVMMASKVAGSPGAEDPDAFTGTGTDANVAYHFALRPAETPTILPQMMQHYYGT